MRYLTEEELNELVARCKNLAPPARLRHPRRPRYTVIVDEKHHYIKTQRALKSFLTGCCFDSHGYKLFVNFDKGITLKLDA